jgi:hypothetical protein
VVEIREYNMSSKQTLTLLGKNSGYLLLLTPLLTPLFFCILLYILAFWTTSPLTQSALLGISGTFLGVSLGTGLSLLVGARQYRNIEELQNSILELPGKIIQIPMLSSEQYISKYRTVFHKYHKTRKQGDEFWIYSIIDFGQDFCPGRLRGKRKIPMNNKLYTYDINGYFLGDRFVFTTEGIGHHEKPSIEIYPSFGAFLDPEVGFMGIHLHMDWDEKDGFDPCLIVAAPYPGTEQEGRQSDAVCKDLDRRWAEKRLPVGMLK